MKFRRFVGLDGSHHVVVNETEFVCECGYGGGAMAWADKIVDALGSIEEYKARAERAEIAQVEQAALSQSRYPVTIDDAIAEGREP